MVQSLLSGFLIKNHVNEPIAYSIYFRSSHQTKLFYKKGKQFYLNLFLQKKQRIDTFNDISESQFFILLRLALTRSLLNGFLLHASAVTYKKMVYIFCGKQEAGKSTIMKLLSQQKDVSAFGDDSVAITLTSSGFQAHQTPFVEKESWLQKKTYHLPIQGVYLIQKSKEVGMRKIFDKDVVLSLFLPQLITDHVVDKKQINNVVSFCKQNDFFFKLKNNLDVGGLSQLLFSKSGPY